MGTLLHQVSEVGEVGVSQGGLRTGCLRRKKTGSPKLVETVPQSFSAGEGAGERTSRGGAYAANALRIESFVMCVTASCVELPPAVMWCCERDSPDQSAQSRF